MSEPKHTPGPWRVRGDWYIGVEGDPFSLAEVKCCKTVPAAAVEVHKANARLIAAAPDLLECCEQLIACLTLPIGADARRVALASAEQVIRWATGEENHS